MPGAESAAPAARAPTRVHPADRVRDWLALGLVVIGALLYAGAHRGMTTLARDTTVTTREAAAQGGWKLVRWRRLERLSRAGVGFVVAGAAVSLWSFGRHAARRREASRAP